MSILFKGNLEEGNYTLIKSTDGWVLKGETSYVGFNFADRKTEPSADRSQEWIPCSEKLPANDDWVIISVLDEVGDTPYRYSDFGWYLEAAKCWIVESEQRTDVVAWMPLPKPYGERESE